MTKTQLQAIEEYANSPSPSPLLQKALRNMLEENKALREALEYYANRLNWDCGDDYVWNMIEDDLELIEYFVEGVDCSDYYGGKLARETLAKFPKKEETGEG